MSLTKQQRWKQKNREKLRQYQKQWWRDNRERCLRIQKRSLEKLKVKALMNLSSLPRCLGCGTKDIRILSVDHINNDGRIEKISSQRLWRKIIYDLSEEEARKKYQILCRNCNWIKHIENSKHVDLVIKDINQIWWNA